MDLDALREEPSSVLLLNPRHHHAAAPLLPVHRGGHLPSSSQLQAVHHPEDLVEVPAGGSRVEQGQLQPLVRPNDKDGPEE